MNKSKTLDFTEKFDVYRALSTNPTLIINDSTGFICYFISISSQ